MKVTFFLGAGASAGYSDLMPTEHRFLKIYDAQRPKIHWMDGSTDTGGITINHAVECYFGEQATSGH